jgi:hypothetical protein
MALAHRFVEGSVSEFACGVDVCTTVKESSQLFYVAAPSSYIERTLPKEADLVNVSQIDVAEGWQVLVHVALEYLCSSEAIF